MSDLEKNKTKGVEARVEQPQEDEHDPVDLLEATREEAAKEVAATQKEVEEGEERVAAEGGETQDTEEAHQAGEELQTEVAGAKTEIDGALKAGAGIEVAGEKKQNTLSKIEARLAGLKGSQESKKLERAELVSEIADTIEGNRRIRDRIEKSHRGKGAGWGLWQQLIESEKKIGQRTERLVAEIKTDKTRIEEVRKGLEALEREGDTEELREIKEELQLAEGEAAEKEKQLEALQQEGKAEIGKERVLMHRIDSEQGMASGQNSGGEEGEIFHAIKSSLGASELGKEYGEKDRDALGSEVKKELEHRTQTRMAEEFRKMEEEGLEKKKLRTADIEHIASDAAKELEEVKNKIDQELKALEARLDNPSFLEQVRSLKAGLAKKKSPGFFTNKQKSLHEASEIERQLQKQHDALTRQLQDIHKSSLELDSRDPRKGKDFVGEVYVGDLLENFPQSSLSEEKRAEAKESNSRARDVIHRAREIQKEINWLPVKTQEKLEPLFSKLDRIFSAK